MKTAPLFLILGLLAATGCSSRTTRLARWDDSPAKTELTATRHVRLRSKQENRQRVEYFNSLQHRGNVKSF
jgi:hypothetical protein